MLVSSPRPKRSVTDFLDKVGNVCYKVLQCPDALRRAKTRNSGWSQNMRYINKIFTLWIIYHQKGLDEEIPKQQTILRNLYSISRYKRNTTKMSKVLYHNSNIRYIKLNHAIVVQAWPCYRVKLQPLTDKWGITTYLICIERVNPGLKSITSYRIGLIHVERVKSGLEFIALGLYASSSQYSSSFMYTSDSTHQTSAIMATTFGTSFMTYIQFTRFLNQYTSTFRSDFESIHLNNWDFESVALPALRV